MFAFAYIYMRYTVYVTHTQKYFLLAGSCLERKLTLHAKANTLLAWKYFTVQ